MERGRGGGGNKRQELKAKSKNGGRNKILSKLFTIYFEKNFWSEDKLKGRINQV